MFCFYILYIAPRMGKHSQKQKHTRLHYQRGYGTRLRNHHPYLPRLARHIGGGQGQQPYPKVPVTQKKRLTFSRKPTLALPAMVRFTAIHFRTPTVPFVCYPCPAMIWTVSSQEKYFGCKDRKIRSKTERKRHFLFIEREGFSKPEAWKSPPHGKDNSSPMQKSEIAK